MYIATCPVTHFMLLESSHVVNPRRACAARVTVLGQSVCVYDYSGTTGNEATSERYQKLQCNKRSKAKMVILLKQRRSRARNGTIEDHVA